MPLFTVIIPTYNRLETLRQAVLSVQQQTFQDFECYVVDDASTDGSWEMLHSLALDARFHLERNVTNRRQHYSRNRSIEKSTAPWITFLDSDDVWLPQRLERFAQAINASPSTRFLFSNGYWLTGKEITGVFFSEDRAIPTGTVPGYYAVGAEFLPYVTTNIAVHRTCFQNVGLYREDMQILEDTELYARILAAGNPVGVIREKLSLYRMHPGQITRHYRVQFRESVMALQAAATPSAIFDAKVSALIRDTAIFFLKAGQPTEARQFLAEHASHQRFPLLEILATWPAWIFHALRAVIKPIQTKSRTISISPQERAEVQRVLPEWAAL